MVSADEVRDVVHQLRVGSSHELIRVEIQVIDGIAQFGGIIVPQYHGFM